MQIISPIVREYIWGTEAWALSSHPAARNLAADFPLLLKVIRAKTPLSVQVHPDDAYAAEHENGSRGKTEMWIVLEAEPDAFLYCGFEREVARAEFEDAIRRGTLTTLLHRAPVRAGDVFFIPAGTIHAIGGGITIAEIQQSSDITYRVYDYGRLDGGGNPRPLHVKQAVEVTTLEKWKPSPALPIECDYFRVSEIAAGTAVTGECAVWRPDAECVYLSDGEEYTASAKSLLVRKGVL